MFEGVKVIDQFKAFGFFLQVINGSNIHKEIKRQFRFISQEFKKIISAIFPNCDRLVPTKIVTI